MGFKKTTVVSILSFVFSGVAMPCSGATSQQTADLPSDRPVRISGAVMAGNLLMKKVPLLSREADCAQVNSFVALRVIIGKDGSVKRAEVLLGALIVAEPLLNAVREWMYKPFLMNGRPVEVETTITNIVHRNCPNS